MSSPDGCNTEDFYDCLVKDPEWYKAGNPFGSACAQDSGCQPAMLTWTEDDWNVYRNNT